jgi:hypothetical protein
VESGYYVSWRSQWDLPKLSVWRESIFTVLCLSHLRSGRGDRRGAIRFACSSYVVSFIFLILTFHHLYDVGYEWEWLEASIGMAAGVTLTMAIFYLALEPYIRRTWPELLVSWTRILSGEFTDPLVGRDLFLGILLGAAEVSLWVSLVASPFF